MPLPRDESGYYILDGIPIHAGDMLQVWVGSWKDGHYEPCRFEWMWPGPQPALFFGERGRLMTDDDQLRWPK
jgi:hypothetical protein